MAADSMKEMVKKGKLFDLIFTGADKKNYIEYYELSTKPQEQGDIILTEKLQLCVFLFNETLT